jgi:HrpA-like RNA helicase
LPQYLAELLEWQGSENRKVICTQPRKVSATSLAERVSEEWSVGDKTKVGSAVGYRVGAQKKSSKFSCIEYVTEGTFLATLLQIFGDKTAEGGKGTEMAASGAGEGGKDTKDPLKGVGAIVVDEAHERSTTCDLILGMVKMHAPTKWPDLKIVVTSATLDSTLFSGYFYNCPVLKIPGRMFPVDVKYLPLEGNASGVVSASDKYAKAVVMTALEIHNSGDASGDILCFLTGQDETEKAKDQFAALSKKHQYGPAISLALYGRQLPAEQKLVFDKAPRGTRKVIFATDVAETGVTIDGVRHIVDAGLCKESHYDAKRNVTVLSVQSICQSSAIQRKGRAGRTAPGTCYRLYSEDEFDAMDVSQVPEVLSRPLPLTVISLLSMGIDPLHFQWIQSPSQEGLQKAMDDLMYLGAITSTDSSGSGSGGIPVLTELGELIAVLQVDPGMARMVYHACKQGMGEAACALAGIMSVASSFYFRGSVNDNKGREAADEKHLAFCCEEGDMVAMYGAFSEWQSLMNSFLDAPVASSPSKTAADEATEVSILEDSDTDSIERDLKENSSSAAASVAGSDSGGSSVSKLIDLFSNMGGSGYDAPEFPEPDVKADVKADALPPPPAVQLMDDDDDGDDASVMSALSDLTDVAAEISFQEKKKSRFAASNQAKKWCRDNFLNNKSLGIALSAKNDIIRLLRTFKGGALWKSLADGTTTDQTIPPSTVDIQRLIVKGLFLNVSIQTKECRGYEVLRNDTPTVGMIHPGSSLVKIANNSHSDKKGNVFPRFIVFHTMLTTSRTFLNVVTPISEEWIREESPDFYNTVMVTNMARSRCAQFLIEGLRMNTSRALLGKFGDKKSDLEASLNCSIQYDAARCVLEVWCTPGSLERTKQELEAQIQRVKQMCLDEVEETVICGNTRAVFGAGGQVKCLLFGNEFVTVNIRGLSMKTTPAELKEYLSQSFGDVHSVDVTYPSSGQAGQKNGNNNAFAKVVFGDPQEAARAQEQLQGEVWQGHALSTSRGGMRSSAISAVNSAQLVMSWALSASEGKASAEFTSPAAANAILQLCLATKGLNCPVLQGLGPEVRIRANIPPGANPKKTAYLFPSSGGGSAAGGGCRVSIKGLHPHIDEHDLEMAFKQLEQMKRSTPQLQAYQCPARVKVFRATPQESLQDETALSIQTAELRDMIPLADHLVSATSFFDSGGHSGRAGFYLQYDSIETTSTVRSAWEEQLEGLRCRDVRSVAGEPLWLKCGQPVRLTEKFTSNINVHTALWNFFKNDVDACMQRLKGQFHVHCRIAKPRTAIGGKKHAEPKTIVYMNAPSLATLELSVAEMKKIFVCKVYTPRNDQEKHILFSPPGCRAMKDISDKVTYLHWDHSSRIVRVYGPDDTTQAAMNTITENIKRIAEAQETASFPVSPRKRKELLIAWKLLKGPLKDDLMSFRVNGLLVDVQGTTETLLAVEDWLRAGKFIQTAPTKQQQQQQQSPSCCQDDEELCSVCMCEVEQPSYYYRACDHGGCTSCVQYQFSRLAEITVPVTCFSAECNRSPISWPDIKAVVPPDAVDVIKSASVYKYIREHGRQYRCCPSPGCEQIVDLSAVVTPGSAMEEEGLGGAVTYCDQCKVEYCLHCSDRDNKPRESHKGDACADTLEDANAWRPLFQHVTDNILTLRCPSCQAAFLDFNGCCAVECGCCKKYFCGYCLNPDQNSSTSHAHVIQCKKNSRRDYFCSQSELDKIHRFARIGQLRSYFEKTVPKGDTKRKLLKNLEPVLADLGIFPKDVVS